MSIKKRDAFPPDGEFDVEIEIVETRTYKITSRKGREPRFKRWKELTIGVLGSLIASGIIYLIARIIIKI